MIHAMKRLYEPLNAKRAALALQTLAEQDQQNSNANLADDAAEQPVRFDALDTPSMPLTVYPY